MSLVDLGNKFGLLIAVNTLTSFSAENASILDAVGESQAIVGQMILASGPGTSKTLSAAGGGQIIIKTTLVTQGSGTDVRVGLQDVGATGLEDGTFDVSGDFVGATNPLVLNSINRVTMATGSKTVSHGDLIAVVVEMVARASSDAVRIVRGAGTPNCLMPYCTIDSGSGPTKNAGQPMYTVIFDDGTMGWLALDSFAHNEDNPTAFGVSSTPDEHALIFEIPYKANAISLFMMLSSFGTSDDFEAIIYSDPLGTPTVQATITVDADLTGGSGANPTYWEQLLSSPFTFQPNTLYAIALRPTTGNTLSYRRANFGSGNSDMRAGSTFGLNARLGTRTDQTGAFTEDTTIIPFFGFRAYQLDDGTSGGGSSEHSYVS